MYRLDATGQKASQTLRRRAARISIAALGTARSGRIPNHKPGPKLFYILIQIFTRFISYRFDKFFSLIFETTLAAVGFAATISVLINRRCRLPLILLNKPYRVLSQFRDRDGRATLADLIQQGEVYPAGRLDYDSEGLLLLTDDGRLQAGICEPRSKITKTYWVQVEGSPSAEQLAKLRSGVTLRDGPANAIVARLVDATDKLWKRDPPIRHRITVPDSWIEIGISEGRNRLERRMTAAVGLPTLRLIRMSIGPWSLDDLQAGQSRANDNEAAWQQLESYRR